MAPNVTTCTGTVSQAHPGLRLGRMGAWLNPAYGDDARTGLAIQAESLGHAARQMSLPLRHIRRRKRRSLMTSTVIPIAIAAFLSGAVADPLPEDCARRRGSGRARYLLKPRAGMCDCLIAADRFSVNVASGW
jgi:hypothetical protein